MTSLTIPGMGFEDLLDREWLTVNHLGGYASSTVPGCNTRKYHGLLVASMSPPVRRMVILSRVEETVTCAKQRAELACSEYPGTIHPAGYRDLRAFSDVPHPRWAYQGDGWTIQKELQLLPGENTVVLTYILLGSNSVELEIRPLFALRGIHELSLQWYGKLDATLVPGDARQWRIPCTSRTPDSFFAHDGTFEPLGSWYLNTIYRREQERGYRGLEDLWMPGIVSYTLSPGKPVRFVVSTEPIEWDRVVERVQRHTKIDDAIHMIAGAKKDEALVALQRAAGQFVVALPFTLETQFHWSPPNVRDALIAMPGLLLTTHRFAEASALLTSLAGRVNNGLLPTELPEDATDPKPTSADASLWFVNAVYEYLRYTNDDATVRRTLFDAVLQILSSYGAGTGLGIGCDPDGILRSNAAGAGTTWMNAKVGDWVITPRQGRPVELSALWYNALRIGAHLCERFGRRAEAEEFSLRAATTRAAFNARFWNEGAKCCYDVLGDMTADGSIRPNQLFAISLPFPVLSEDRWRPVLDVVRSALLTPYGLRSLAQTDRAYQPRFTGDAVSRERALHQGSVHPWLLAAYIRALSKVSEKNAEFQQHAYGLLQGCFEHLVRLGGGQLCELFDGESPHRHGGAIASARNVGCLLQSYVEDVINLGPAQLPNSDKITQLPESPVTSSTKGNT